LYALIDAEAGASPLFKKHTSAMYEENEDKSNIQG
jgi:hypothetical protein